MIARSVLAVFAAAVVFTAAHGQARSDKPVRQAVAEAILEKYADILPPGADLSISSVMSPAGRVSGRFLDVRDVGFDLPTGRFVAVLLTSNGHFEIVGRASAEVSVPMPNRRIEAGETIDAGDLAMTPIAVRMVGTDVVRDLEAVTGAEARRTLQPGRPVQTNDIGAPTLIEKNQLVTLSYRKGVLAITARGRALDEGGVGDIIRVMNIDSNKVVSGRITADGAVALAS